MAKTRICLGSESSCTTEGYIPRDIPCIFICVDLLLLNYLRSKTLSLLTPVMRDNKYLLQ